MAPRKAAISILVATVVFHTLTLNNTITTTTSTENTVTEPPIYTTAQNHTMLLVYNGVNACLFTITSH